MLALLRQPRWVGLLAVTAGLCLLFWWLGSWQFDRHQERSARNTAVDSALRQPPTDLQALMPDPGTLPPENEHRSAVVTGRYLADEQTLQRNPRGRSGFAVLTPLRLDSGGTIIVERGFVPRALDDPNSTAEAVDPPTGPVELTVRLRQPQAASDRVAPTGQVYVIDPTTYPAALPTPVYAGYGELTRQTPEPDQVLELPPTADIGMGPHLYYAIQWWLFIPLAVVGLVLLLRREARELDTPETPTESVVPH